MTEEQAIQKMWEDIRYRNLSNSTYKNYTCNIKKFFAFCRKPLEELDENDVRNFLHYLIDEKKYAPTTVNQSSTAIHFFFAVSLNHPMNYLQIPLVKVPKTLPAVLTREEVSSLIRACTNTKHRALLLLAYGSGLRSEGIETLRVKDIDSKEMRIFVKGGKNKRDRYTLLSQTTLEEIHAVNDIIHCFLRSKICILTRCPLFDNAGAVHDQVFQPPAFFESRLQSLYTWL